MKKHYCDVLIIGSGVAALQTAIYASRTKNVTIVTKTGLRDGNTYLAQGGIAVAHAGSDDVESHIIDTMVAGRKHNDEDAVTALVTKGIDVMDEVLAKGMEFDRDSSGQLLYGLEGAHSRRRILHSYGDSTGKYLLNFLLQQLQRTSVDMHEEKQVLQLILSDRGECVGALAEDEYGEPLMYVAAQTVLATGGCGQLYAFSTNSDNATGDGFWLALKAGAILRDMEFVQFHPTGLYINGKVEGLISEAVRGEGAKLTDSKDKRIMEGVHELEDLAPRHVVAEQINGYLEKGEQIFLDIRNVADFPGRFPGITKLCGRFGVDWRSGKIPVAPASHFMMGGIETDLQGRTSVPNLFAVGEVACTGVHGANRLASNSLLEGLVFGKELGCLLQQLPVGGRNVRVPEKREYGSFHLPEKDDLRKMMWRYAGVVRNEEGLLLLLKWLKQYDFLPLLNGNTVVYSKEESTKASMLMTAMCIVNAALLRKESRGASIRKEYMGEDPQLEAAVTNIHMSCLEGRIVYEQVKA